MKDILLFYRKIQLQIPDQLVNNQYPCCKVIRQLRHDPGLDNVMYKIPCFYDEKLQTLLWRQTAILHCRNMVLVHTLSLIQFSSIVTVTIAIFIGLNQWEKSNIMWKCQKQINVDINGKTRVYKSEYGVKLYCLTTDQNFEAHQTRKTFNNFKEWTTIMFSLGFRSNLIRFKPHLDTRQSNNITQ